tara:strand:+ start:32 stop:1720 length:1689 start_codon:yes stop_codon:yes gene_type:complete
MIFNLINGQEYWAVVVAVDQYGNTTNTVTAVGPTYPRNDVPNAVNLQLSVSSEISLGSPFLLEITAEIDQVTATPPGTILITMETDSGTYPIGTSWDPINLTDFADLGVFTSNISGDVTFLAEYNGDIGDEQNRPISSANTATNSVVTVGALFTSSESTYELDWDNETDVRVNLIAINSAQTSMLEGANITWTIFNSSTNTTLTDTALINDGFSQFLVNFPGGGTLFVNLTEPTWIDVESNSIEIMLVTFGSVIDDNETEENETTETPWAPEIMNDVIVDCGEVIIDPSQDQEIDCSITNPNNYTIDVSLEPNGWSNWPSQIEFNLLPGQSEFSLDDSASNTINLRVDLLENISDIGLKSGKILIELRQGPRDYMVPGDKPLTIEIQWVLKGETLDVDPDPNQNNTNQTAASNKENTDNTMLYIGGIGAIAFIGLVVFIIIRIKNSDNEEWDEEDLDLEPKLELQRMAKPLPVGVALDEFDDKTISDETPDRPDFIADFEEEDEEISLDEESDDESGKVYEETSDEDSEITVDEHGTEWYEDEIGAWWYRDAGKEDWSEFVE